MKKILMFLLCTVVLFSATIPFYGETVTSLPGTATQNLTVKYVNNSAGISAPVSDGETEGQLPDGTDFSAQNLPDTAQILRVYPVQKTEEEAYGWIESGLGKKVQVLLPYHVSCTDQAGKDVSNQGAKITLEAPADLKEDFEVYALDSSGKVKLLTKSFKSGKITFTANGASFYVICTASDNPATSDLNVAAFCVSLGSVAILGAVIFLVAKRRRSK